MLGRAGGQPRFGGGGHKMDAYLRNRDPRHNGVRGAVNAVGSQARLLRYAWKHWNSLAVVLLTTFISIGTSLLLPWPIKILVDQVLGHHSLPGVLHRLFMIAPGPHDAASLLAWVSASTVILYVISSLTQMANTLTSVTFGQRVTYDVGADVFLHVQRLSLLFHNRQPVGDTIARVTGDSYCVQQIVMSVILPLLQSIVTVAATFVILWNLSPAMTLVSMGVAPFLILSVRIMVQPMKSRSRQKRDLEGQMMSVAQEALTAVPAVQAFSREEREHARFRAYADQTVKAYVKLTSAQIWFRLATGLVTALATAALMYVGGHLALEGKITTGTIILFMLYLQNLYSPLNSLSMVAATFQVTAAQADRVLEMLDTPVEIRDAPDAQDLEIRGDIRYEHVCFAYEPGVPVLRDITFEAFPGEVVAIVGATGAGKTTLISQLIRFYDPSTGQVTIDGRDIRRIRLASLRRQVAIVLQDPFIFPRTVAENIAYGRPDASLEEIIDAARAANADSFIERLPNGYDTVIGEQGATLSGGEKQRLSIARAFLKDAPILILDEPTSQLDAGTEARLLDALQRLMHTRTTLIIAHRLSTIRNADQILVMDGGRIVERGCHSDLMMREGVYAGLYRQQMDIARHESVPGVPPTQVDA